MRKPRVRTGFTLIELLTVIAIISILVSLLLPAVQQAREIANRMQCSNNMRQLGIGLHNHLAEKNVFPTAGASFDSSGNPIFDSTTSASTLASLLPYIEQSEIWNQYDITQSYNASAGNIAAAQNPVRTFLCPTNPFRQRTGVDSLGYGMTDYMPLNAAGINPNNATGNSVRQTPNTTANQYDLGGLRVPAAGPYVVTDGLSKTICIVEDVGRSEFFFDSRYADPVGAANGHLLPAGGVNRDSFRWAEPASTAPVSAPVGTTYGSARLKIINNNNYPLGGPSTCFWTNLDCGPSDEPFSFHSGGGVNALFMDGHVTFIRDDVDPVTFRRLVTAQEGLNSGYIE